MVRLVGALLMINALALGCVEELEANGWMMPETVDPHLIAKILDTHKLVPSDSTLWEPVAQVRQMLEPFTALQRKIFILRYNLDREHFHAEPRTYAEIALLVKRHGSQVGQVILSMLKCIQATPLISLEGLPLDKRPIRFLDISAATRMRLLRGVDRFTHTLGDLSRLGEDDLLEIAGFGRERLEEVKAALQKLGLSLQPVFTLEDLRQFPVDRLLPLPVKKIYLSIRTLRQLHRLEVFTVLGIQNCLGNAEFRAKLTETVRNELETRMRDLRIPYL